MMTTPLQPWLAEIPGAEALCDWYGYWPTFHDAEVISLSLNREGDSVLRIHTWEMSGDVDERGYYLQRKHVIVAIQLRGVVDLELTGFNSQNVLRNLTFTRTADGYALQLGPCYGLAGSILAKEIAIHLEPAGEGIDNAASVP